MATIRGHPRIKDRVIKDEDTNDQLEKLDTFKQNRIHVIEDSKPTNAVGINGEIRILFQQPNNIRLLVKIDGSWKTSGKIT